ncbi:MAG: hypothetical protein M1828_002726 [Chrysothrix sp. TS-e1954]|nr:MAG: hypothetical protein M1828_002726 [Chrysothrix sp. TS-e1954]
MRTRLHLHFDVAALLLFSTTTQLVRANGSFLQNLYAQFSPDDAYPPQILPELPNTSTSSAATPTTPHQRPLHPFAPATPTCPSTNPYLSDLRKRQSTCASGYTSCADTAGNPGLCCPNTAICSADAMGSVGCCPHGAACTGTVGAPTSTATATAAGATSGGAVIGGGAVGTDNQQTTSTSMMTGPAVLTGSGGEVTATVSMSGFVSGETVFAAAAARRGVGDGGGWAVGWGVLGLVGAVGL